MVELSIIKRWKKSGRLVDNNELDLTAIAMEHAVRHVVSVPGPHLCRTGIRETYQWIMCYQ